jgi:hypothetical protein
VGGGIKTACWPLASLNGNAEIGKTRRVGFIQKGDVKRKEADSAVQEAAVNGMFVV